MLIQPTTASGMLPRLGISSELTNLDVDIMQLWTINYSSEAAVLLLRRRYDADAVSYQQIKIVFETLDQEMELQRTLPQ